MPNLNCELLKVNGLPGVAVVTLHGSIDPRSVEPLAGALEPARAKGYRTFVIDLGDVRYINSAGLSYLVHLADGLTGRGGGLHLANAQPKVKVVFDLMGVTQFFRLYKSVPSALAAISAARRPARPRGGLATARRQ
jgi:anti-anti-sigma factor